MSRILTALNLIIVAFLIPWIVMATIFALTQTSPPVVDIPWIKTVFRYTPIWDDLHTAFRNQHRLLIAGLPTFIFLAALALLINPKNRNIIFAFYVASIVTVAFFANRLDCWWLFRGQTEYIFSQSVIRSIPWIACGMSCLWILTRIQKNRTVKAVSVKRHESSDYTHG